MESKIEKSFPLHMNDYSDRVRCDDFTHTSKITLRRDEICVFKDICPFNTTSHWCHGAVERNNDFVCNLKQLKSMHKSEVE
jgi:hypothetical protein